jgi:hypothetical protein
LNTRRLALSAIAAAAFYPAVSGAYPGKTSLDACVNAFEKTLPAGEAPSRTYKVVYLDDRWNGSLAQFFPMRYTFDLQANDPKTGAPMARARCSADSRGTISKLSPLPMTGRDPTLAAAH